MTAVAWYFAGVVSAPIVLVFLWIVRDFYRSFVNWRTGEFGKGFEHEVETAEESGRWSRAQHVHYWPDVTPWWVIKSVEPLRVRRCVARPDHRPVREGEL